MGLIREPLDVDFTVEPRILTKAEKDTISKYIRDYKTKETATKNLKKGRGKTFTEKRAQAEH